jgi:hypothetical protein
VGAAAEVDEAAVAVEADLVAGVGEFGDKMGLHEIPILLEALERVFPQGGLATNGSSRAMTSAILASMAARSSGVKGFSR